MKRWLLYQKVTSKGRNYYSFMYFYSNDKIYIFIFTLKSVTEINQVVDDHWFGSFYEQLHRNMNIWAYNF